MGDLGDRELRDLLIRDAAAGWRVFVDRYTPMLLALIERAGVVDRDEAMEVYLRTCERLSADGCGRLRGHDPSKGPFGAWLPVVVRNVIVDWVRSRTGRRRLFKAVDRLPRRAQQVFELYYWDDRTPSEICEILTMRESRKVSLSDVFADMDAIDAVLTDRHRRDLLAMSVRSRAPLSLEAELEAGHPEPADPRASSEQGMRTKELAAELNRALGALDREDAAIARLKFVEGMTVDDVRRALHLDGLTEERVRSISARLRSLLAGRSGAAVALLAAVDGSLL